MLVHGSEKERSSCVFHVASSPSVEGSLDTGTTSWYGGVMIGTVYRLIFKL